MAEALCGPSNPLQNIQKHAGVDRTLQQDRLRFNRGPSQSFRSAPGYVAGAVDAEFEAFQAGHLPSGVLPGLPPQAFGQSHLTGQSSQQLPGWASDFQRLNISQARSSPIPTAQFRHEAPLQRSNPGGWHQEFMRHNESHKMPQNDDPPNYGGTGWHHQSHLQSLSFLNGATNPPYALAQQKQAQQQMEELSYEAAFEQASKYARMETSENTVISSQNSTQSGGHDVQKESEAEAADELKDWWARSPALRPQNGESSEHLLQSIMAHQQRVLDQSDVEKTADAQEFDNHALIGSDAILDEASKQDEEHSPEWEADELARTAGQLLDNLKHEQSQKFQDSSFLSLMRQLRDKEVRVEGDNMVDVSS